MKEYLFKTKAEIKLYYYKIIIERRIKRMHANIKAINKVLNGV